MSHIHTPDGDTKLAAEITVRDLVEDIAHGLITDDDGLRFCYLEHVAQGWDRIYVYLKDGRDFTISVEKGRV